MGLRVWGLLGRVFDGCLRFREAFSSFKDVCRAPAEAGVASGAGECLLEWDSVDGQKAPVPLLKDMFGSERRKAKVLNFSIAYGKTAHGLSRDWGTSLEEAKETVDRWYSDRPEVRIRGELFVKDFCQGLVEF